MEKRGTNKNVRSFSEHMDLSAGQEIRNKVKDYEGVFQKSRTLLQDALFLG